MRGRGIGYGGLVLPLLRLHHTTAGTTRVGHFQQLLFFVFNISSSHSSWTVRDHKGSPPTPRNTPSFYLLPMGFGTLLYCFTARSSTTATISTTTVFTVLSADCFTARKISHIQYVSSSISYSTHIHSEGFHHIGKDSPQCRRYRMLYATLLSESTTT